MILHLLILFTLCDFKESFFRELLRKTEHNLQRFRKDKKYLVYLTELMLSFTRFCLMNAPSRHVLPGKIGVKQAFKSDAAGGSTVTTVTSLLKKLTPKQRLQVSNTLRHFKEKGKPLPTSTLLVRPPHKPAAVPKMKSSVLLPRRPTLENVTSAKKRVMPVQQKPMMKLAAPKHTASRISFSSSPNLIKKTAAALPSVKPNKVAVDVRKMLHRPHVMSPLSVARRKSSIPSKVPIKSAKDYQMAIKTKAQTLSFSNTVKKVKKPELESKVGQSHASPAHRVPSRLPIRIKQSAFAARMAKKSSPSLRHSSSPMIKMIKPVALKKKTPSSGSHHAPAKKGLLQPIMKQNVKAAREGKEGVTLPITHKTVKSSASAKKVLFKPVPVRYNVFSRAINNQAAPISHSKVAKVKKLGDQ